MQPIGYQALVDRFELDVLRPARVSLLHGRSGRITRRQDGITEEYYPARYAVGDSWQAHLQFALKHEGVNLEILAALFRRIDAAAMTALVQSAPTGRYIRVAWFLYEWLTGQSLPVGDLEQGNYVPVLDEAAYYALPRSEKRQNVRRQRVVDNLPGSPAYCPLIRRTEELRRFEEEKLDAAARAQVSRYPAGVLLRAAQYLYTKETRSSYAIEHLEVDQRRTVRFVNLLRQAGRMDCYAEESLTRLQNAIVDERYAAAGFRDSQNYVGESLGPTRELVHYVAPRPGDLAELMSGWMQCCRGMQAAHLHPVVVATVAGFGFVFLHPFEDGNGRLHRFLLHHALAAGEFTPPGIVFPVSATMLKQMHRYDAALEWYSREVNNHVDYTLNDQGVMRVNNETAAFYRYPDLTPQAEALFGFIRDTIQTEMVSELEYLAAFDAIRDRMRKVVDMPNRRLNLLIRLSLQGKGLISKTKRALFEELTEDECRRLREITLEEIAHINPLNEE